MIFDHTAVRLGKNTPRVDQRTLKLAKYLTPSLPAPVPTDWSKGTTEWGMMVNDTLGDCTIAGCGHAVQVACVNTTGMMMIPDSEIVKFYSLWCGYVPGDSNTDQGGVEIDILNRWRAQEPKFVGHELMAYATPDPGNSMHIKQSIQLFGGVYIGLGLPVTAQTQDIWDVNGDATDPNSPAFPGSWGGHCVYVLAWDENYLTCVTWGKLMKMTWAFWNTYCDESYSLLLGYWFENNMFAPSGWTPNELLADVAALGN